MIKFNNILLLNKSNPNIIRLFSFKMNYCSKIIMNKDSRDLLLFFCVEWRVVEDADLGD